MASVTAEQLKKHISEILKDADLAETSAKKVRQQLEQELKCNLISRKKEVDTLVMEYVNSRMSDEDNNEDNEESDDEKEEQVKKLKRPAPEARNVSTKKKKSKSSSEDETTDEDDNGVNNDDDSDDNYRAKETVAKLNKNKGKKNDSDNESDEEWKKPKKAKRATSGAKSSGGKGKGTGFTRPYNLSPDLAALMGSESLPRHEVVKKMWALIKERNLLDPKNKQFALCDNDLFKVIGVKRFRTFGMLKYLRAHFLD